MSYLTWGPHIVPMGFKIRVKRPVRGSNLSWLDGGWSKIEFTQKIDGLRLARVYKGQIVWLHLHSNFGLYLSIVEESVQFVLYIYIILKRCNHLLICAFGGPFIGGIHYSGKGTLHLLWNAAFAPRPRITYGEKWIVSWLYNSRYLVYACIY